MQTSGLILDIYDDFRGETLRSVFPRQSDMPESVKTAQVLSSEDRNLLPDDAFALVMVNEGDKLRKFACIDEGNTQLSVMYFVKNAHKLPVIAQKTAAENLMKACGWYGLEIPTKLAEITGTSCMPYQSPTTKGTPKTVIQKTASMTPVVDITNEEVVVTETEKKASRFALPSEEKYPLDTYFQVKTAGAYFDEFHVRFEDEDKQEFATNLVKRASELGIDVSEDVRYYADPDEAMKLAFERPWSEVIGNDYINETQLNLVARKEGSILKKMFDEDFVREFCKDPKGIFQSLPRTQKVLIMRLASDDAQSTL